MNWMLNDLSIKVNDFMLLIDRKPAHTSRYLMVGLNKLKYCVVFLPLYSHILKPIEMMIHVMKIIMSKNSKEEVIRLCSNNGMRT